MATSRAEVFILSNSNSHKDLEFFINTKGEIFAQEIGDSGYESFFCISKDDWQELRKFIDEQFDNYEPNEEK